MACLNSIPVRAERTGTNRNKQEQGRATKVKVKKPKRTQVHVGEPLLLSALCAYGEESDGVLFWYSTPCRL